jgi:hypothetical protein
MGREVDGVVMNAVNKCGRALFVLLFFAMAAQAAPPAAKTASAQDATGPSLKEIAESVQQQLSAIGTLNYMLRSHDSISGATSTTQMSASASGVGLLVYKEGKSGTRCLLSYHDRETENNQLIEDRDLGVLLNDVAEVAVTPVESFDQNVHPTRKITLSTPIFRLDLRSDDGGDNILFFPNLDLANDVAKTIIHVVELCAKDDKRTTQSN